jgi:hypothetical protein
MGGLGRFVAASLWVEDRRIVPQIRKIVGPSPCVAVTVAISKDDAFKARYWDALSRRGGPGRKGAKMQSIVKMMAKLLRVAFAVMRDEVSFEPGLAGLEST